MTRDATVAVLWVAVTLYCLLGGADFGAGFWNLTSGRTEHGARARRLAETAIGPVWEANHVWLIFSLIVFWTAFPPAFGAMTSTLYDPIMLAALAIVLRGAGFAFHHSLRARGLEAVTEVLFSVASVAAPFFLGTVVGAVASGRVPAGGNGPSVSSWTAPTPLLVGALFVLTGAWLGAAYLVVESRQAGDEALARHFRWRACAAGVAAGAPAIALLFTLHHDATRTVHRLLSGPGLPFVVVSAAAVLATFVMLAQGGSRLPIRATAALAVTAMLWGFGVSQFPYLLVGSLTLAQASSPAVSQQTLLVVFGVVVVTVGPALGLLFVLDRRGALVDSEVERLEVLAAAEGISLPDDPPPGDGGTAP